MNDDESRTDGPIGELVRGFKVSGALRSRRKRPHCPSHLTEARAILSQERTYDHLRVRERTEMSVSEIVTRQAVISPKHVGAYGRGQTREKTKTSWGLQMCPGDERYPLNHNTPSIRRR